MKCRIKATKIEAKEVRKVKEKIRQKIYQYLLKEKITGIKNFRVESGY